MTETATLPDTASADARIDAALLELAADGQALTHDAVARISGVSRRTVYRRYADQPRLRRRLWQLLSPPAGMPRDAGRLLDHELRESFEGFDRKAAAMTVATASPEGRLMRLENREERVACYGAAFAPFTAGLTDDQRARANAVMQLLCCGLAWREMRDQWHLSGTEASEASVWALKVLMAHLEREGADAFAV